MWSIYDSSGRQLATTLAAQGYFEIINVKDYGAKGDGSTDDRTAIQAAINAAGAGGVSARGVDLFFPAGVYNISGTLTCPFNNIMWRGAGWQSTVIMATFTTTDIIQLGDGTTHSGCGIMNMSIWCNAARTTGASININLMSDCLIHNFVINNCFQGILVQGVALKVWIDQGEINNIHVGDGDGIRVSNGAGGDTYITDIVMSNSPASKPATGIHIIQSGHASILRCNITSCTKGLLVDPTAGQDVSYLFIDHSLFDSCGSHAMHFNPSGAATARVRSVVCSNSWFSGTLAAGAGIEFTIASSAIIDDVSFVGCRVLNNYNHGVTINAGPTNISFSDCTIAGNGQQTINTYDGINIAANAGGISIMGCTIGQAGTATNQQRYAIAIAAGTGANIQITNNTLAPNGTVGTGSYMNIGALSGANNNIRGNNPQSNGAACMSAPVATSGTGETFIFRLAIPANSVKVGDMFLIEAHGISSSTGTLIFRVKVGANGTTSDTQCWISLTSAAQVANQRAGFKGLLVVRSIGGSGTIQCECIGYAQAALLPTVVAAVGTPTVVTTALWYIDITCTCSVGTWTAQEATIIPVTKAQ